MILKSAKTDGLLIQGIEALCMVNGCECIAVRKKAKLCEKHYIRQRRNGTTDKKNAPDIIMHSHGYVLKMAKGHLLCVGKPSGSRIYEHRMKFFDAYGGESHPCHWCGTFVKFDDMHVDHLNAVRTDNQIENLVASCAKCNMARGIQKMKKTQRDKGINICYNGITKHISEWADKLGITSSSMRHRIKSGWSLEDVVTKPRGVSGPNAQRRA